LKLRTEDDMTIVRGSKSQEDPGTVVGSRLARGVPPAC
jgi:hypothetical protein